MSQANSKSASGLLCIAATSAFYLLTATAQEPKGSATKQDDKTARGAVSAKEPLPPGYKVGQGLEVYFREYLVTGSNALKPGESAALVHIYKTRPVVMVYTRAINPPIIRLIKKLDEATETRRKERLASYVVLICDSQDREKELKALAEKEQIRHTLLSLVTLDESARKRFDARFGAEAETTVILATAAERRVQACSAYRKGELRDKDIDQVLADLPKILPKAD